MPEVTEALLGAFLQGIDCLRKNAALYWDLAPDPGFKETSFAFFPFEKEPPSTGHLSRDQEKSVIAGSARIYFEAGLLLFVSYGVVAKGSGHRKSLTDRNAAFEWGCGI